MTKTTNYQLNQWEKTDHIMMDDFNADNQKIDAALKACSCRLYTASYVGTGEDARTWTFPAKPALVIITSSLCFYVMVRDAALGFNFVVHGDGIFTTTWEGNSVQLSGPNSKIANSKDGEYSLFALLEAE